MRSVPVREDIGDMFAEPRPFAGLRVDAEPLPEVVRMPVAAFRRIENEPAAVIAALRAELPDFRRGDDLSVLGADLHRGELKVECLRLHNVERSVRFLTIVLNPATLEHGEVLAIDHRDRVVADSVAGALRLASGVLIRPLLIEDRSADAVVGIGDDGDDRFVPKAGPGQARNTRGTAIRIGWGAYSDRPDHGRVR